MTYEEARNHFKDQLDIFVCGEHHEAMKVAIESLEKQSRIVEQLEELRQEYPYKVVGEYDTYSTYNEAWSDCSDRAIAIVQGVRNYD